MSGDWTSSRRIGRHVGRRLRAMSSDIGRKGSDITPRRSDFVEVNIPIGQYAARENDAPKGSNKVLDEPMICRIT